MEDSYDIFYDHMKTLSSFLKANGYQFDGHIGIIPKKEWFNSWKPEDDATSGHYRVKFNWNTDLG